MYIIFTPLHEQFATSMSIDEEAGCVSDEDDVQNCDVLRVLPWTTDALGISFLDGSEPRAKCVQS
jgi:hypothetical protein